MSISDTNDYQDLAHTAASDVAERFGIDLKSLFKEDPRMFEGYSTEKEWSTQVENAMEWLEDAIAHVILTEIEVAETRLHDGDFLDASVACRKARQVV
tara:strand:+ start:823 stop:1116 length:294 start_codon:yes stop_codon:yes gene_type:complete